MAISINEIENGMALQIDNNLFIVEEFNHVKPGKGSAFVRVRVRNIATEQVLEKTFRSAERLDDVPLEQKKLQVLYKSGDSYHFMDMSTYEQFDIPLTIIGEGFKFLKENLEVIGMFHDNKVLKVLLPTFITAEVTHTEPGIKGDSSRSGNKPSTIDTGANILVPLFINIGDRVKIDTRTGQYVERLAR